METIFKLDQETGDIANRNNGILNTNMRQITASRGIDAASFNSGVQNFKFELAGNKWWRPSRSYLRLRCSLTKQPVGLAAPLPLTLSDGIAPSMGLCGNLYQNMDFKVGDTTVARVSNNVAQVDVMKHRLEKSRSWTKSIGQSTNFWSESFRERQNAVCSDGISDELGSSTVARLYLPNYDVLDTVEYKADQTATITYTNAQTADIWQAGDLYSDLNNVLIGVNQVVLDVVANAALKIFVLTLSQTVPIVATAAAAAGNWQRTRNSARSRRVSDFELVWKPPLSVFDYDRALPCGKYELSMLPFNTAQMKANAIESIGLATKVDADYAFKVSEIYLYIEEVEGENCSDMSYLLDLTQLRMQESTFQAAGFSQKSFDVSPATKALTIAYQDLRINSDTRISASKFRVYNDTVPFYAATSIQEDYGLNLQRQYVSYAGQNYPPADADPSFNLTLDHTTQRYVESLIQSEAYYDTGGAETISEFHEAGSYYHQKIHKHPDDMATRAIIYSGFDTTKSNAINGRALLFDEYSSLARIEIHNGSVKQVTLHEV
jgi:hypothetical protein